MEHQIEVMPMFDVSFKRMVINVLYRLSQRTIRFLLKSSSPIAYRPLPGDDTRHVITPDNATIASFIEL
jgi:hypothetical protein